MEKGSCGRCAPPLPGVLLPGGPTRAGLSVEGGELGLREQKPRARGYRVPHSFVSNSAHTG